MVHFQLVFVRSPAANMCKTARFLTNLVALQGKQPLTLLDFPRSTTYTARRHASCWKTICMPT